jgi:hypothetical protein
VERFYYPSYYSKTRDAVCGVSIYHHNGQNVVIASELPENSGTSITNRAEYVHRQICFNHELDPHATIFIEHYPPASWRKGDEDSYSRVSFTISPSGEFSNPEWSHLDSDQVRELIGTEPPRL